MESLNIKIAENIQTIDVVYIKNREYKKNKNISINFPIINWSFIEVIFNGVSSFARPPSVLNKILLTVNKPLPN